MNVTVTANDQEIHASIVGEVDADNCTQMGAALLDTPTAGRPVIVDVSGLTFLDSSGISELLRVRQLVVDAGGSFTLDDPTDSVRRVLEMTGLLQTFGLD